MSIGHRAFDQEELTDASVADLYRALGDRDTPELYEAAFNTDTAHDIPTGAANSIDRKTVYIDRILYQECMDGAFKETGLNPEQILGLWCTHEHCEKAIVDGDNEIDVYYPAHTRALRLEHRHLLAVLGPKNANAKIVKYEETLWPALVRVYHREVKKPPKDLWCGPLLDDPTPRDEEILEQMIRLGVKDANKRSKYEVHYIPGPTYCKDCRMWNPEFLSQRNNELAACTVVSGLVRNYRHCDFWKEK
jgi:hypothetical protein